MAAHQKPVVSGMRSAKGLVLTLLQVRDKSIATAA